MRIINVFLSVIVLSVGLIGQQSGLEVSGEIKADLIDANSVIIKNVADPVETQDAATKGFIDDLLLNFGISLDSAGINGLLALYYSLSELLDEGASPLTMYTAGVPIDSLYGQTYAGGLIFYLDTLNNYFFEGLVAASEDQSTGGAWITKGSTYSTSNGNTNTAIGGNAANTTAMMN